MIVCKYKIYSWYIVKIEFTPTQYIQHLQYDTNLAQNATYQIHWDTSQCIK